MPSLIFVGNGKETYWLLFGNHYFNILISAVDVAKQLLPVPPDGGYGWVIVLAAFCSNLIIDGICTCFTEFKPSYQAEFKGSNALTALIGSLLIGVYLLVGPFVGAMCNKLGARKTVIIGSIIAGCAFILATFSPNLIVFVSIYGVLGGIGFGMIYLPAIVSVGQYFESKRAIATGIAVAGSGVGTMLMPFVARFAIQNLAWKGADFVLAGLISLCIISGLLYRKLTPPALSKKDSVKVKEEPEKEHEAKAIEKMKDALSHCEDDESVFAESWAKSSNDMPMGRIRNELSQCDEDDEMSFAKSWANRQKMPSDAGRRSSAGALSQCDENEEMSFAQSWAKAIADRKQKTNNPLSRVRNELSHCEDGGDKGFAKSWAGQKARRTTVRQRKLTLTGVNEELTQPKGDLAKSIRELRINLTPHEAEEIAKPLNRQDIMYSGSIKRLNRYRKEGGGLSYRASITTIPKTIIEETPLVDEEEKRKCKLCPSFLGDIIDFELLKNPIMLLLCLSNLLASLAYFTPFVFLKDLAISKGIPEKDTIYFVPLIGVTNTVGRILSGWLADRQFVSSLTIVTFSQFICGLLCLAAPFCHTYSMLLVYGALFGFIISAYICLSSIVLADLLGIERLTSSFGLLAVSRGVACLLGTPFAGLAFDVTRSYDVCFYVGGAVLVAASSVSTIIRIVRRYHSRRVHSEGENVEESTE
ncbi:unnamed protein product, partial [Mesorhabditis belari]|uniref:Major facilitator superfamily (MFS) profile domain-containing protein n=1 Tax=Mesorhabditis belari TaxID=2138241 RepID=A0AAF3FI58_9BILA